MRPLRVLLAALCLVLLGAPGAAASGHLRPLPMDSKLTVATTFNPPIGQNVVPGQTFTVTVTLSNNSGSLAAGPTLDFSGQFNNLNYANWMTGFTCPSGPDWIKVGQSCEGPDDWPAGSTTTYTVTFTVPQNTTSNLSYNLYYGSRCYQDASPPPGTVPANYCYTDPYGVNVIKAEIPMVDPVIGAAYAVLSAIVFVWYRKRRRTLEVAVSA